MRRVALLFLLAIGWLCFTATALAQSRFHIGIDPGQVKGSGETGRVLLVLQKADGAPAPTRRSGGSEPRYQLGRTGVNAAPYFGADMDNFTADKQAVIDDSATPFPVAKLSDVPAGNYLVQAVFHTNRDINLPNAFGNLHSKPVRITWDPAKGETHKLTLTERLPDEQVPADTATVKYLKFPSKLLSDFHKRPMFYRVSVILPRDFEREHPGNTYLLCVHIGGYGTRYTMAGMMQPDPRFVQILTDGAGPYGDPYQVNSDNNGPMGDALTQEVIPHIEKTYRCGGTNRRFTTGASTGGWVSLALQIFYPDYFNGCWSSCPDSVDFRAYELINIYEDKNAYVNRYGFERPSQRTLDGDTVMTVRHESQVENVLGRGGNWAVGAKDWCAWNATYGPRGDDGTPKPLWDPKTGVIDRSVTKHWEKYDLRLVLERNWSALAPKLNGKIHVWVGDADDYFLNNAVHRLKASMEKVTPPFEGEITIAPRRNHTSGWSNKQVLDLMEKRTKGE
jgi:S-formylglutathione hydrolase FrmB